MGYAENLHRKHYRGLRSSNHLQPGGFVLMWSATCSNVLTRDLLSDNDNILPAIMVLLFSITIGGGRHSFLCHFLTLS